MSYIVRTKSKKPAILALVIMTCVMGAVIFSNLYDRIYDSKECVCSKQASGWR